ncbi:hypothetical protein GCM10022197_12400 [Microlunatus spumicola]|uniref:HTH araC/xylS-type domain-containing protein n=1 Tax=Microlunatus spumicola TaxID=81499 RepID=A0ABP6X0N2_9ACTN
MDVRRLTRSEVFTAGVAVAAWPVVVADPVPPHVHDFVELALVTTGTARHSTAAGASVLGAGDVVVVRPGAWHAYFPGPEGPCEVINVYLGPETLHADLAWVLDDPRLARLLLVGGRLDPPLAEVPRRRVEGWLHQLAQEQAAPDRRLNAALLQCALVEVSRATAQCGSVAPPALSGPVRDVLLAMTEDLARPWSVTELAARAGLSTSALHRQFREQLGSGPVERLTLLRAEAAATLLVQTDLTVAAVGRLVGWPDPSYASRRFRAIHQVSPAEYRRRHAARR